MQLGFVSALLADLSLEEVLAIAAEEGYDCLEPVCWPSEGEFAGPHHITVEGLGDKQAAEIHRQCEAAGITLTGLGYYPNALSANEAEAATARAHLVKVMDAAVTLGLPLVNTFIGAEASQPLEANLARFREVWPPLIEEANKRGLKIAIENCPMIHHRGDWPGGGNLARSPAAWNAMFEAIPAANFGLNHDPSHLIWQLIDPYRAIADFGDRIFHAHAKDTFIDREQLFARGAIELDWHVPRLPGLGDVDWPRWVEALRAVGYDGPVVVEVEDPDYEGDLARRREALAKSAAFLRPILSG